MKVENPHMLSNAVTITSIFTETTPETSTLDSHVEAIGPHTLRIQFPGHVQNYVGDEQHDSIHASILSNENHSSP